MGQKNTFENNDTNNSRTEHVDTIINLVEEDKKMTFNKIKPKFKFIGEVSRDDKNKKVPSFLKSNLVSNENNNSFIGKSNISKITYGKNKNMNLSLNRNKIISNTSFIDFKK